jgi:hypothetical protein
MKQSDDLMLSCVREQTPSLNSNLFFQLLISINLNTLRNQLVNETLMSLKRSLSQKELNFSTNTNLSQTLKSSSKYCVSPELKDPYQPVSQEFELLAMSLCSLLHFLRSFYTNLF